MTSKNQSVQNHNSTDKDTQRTAQGGTYMIRADRAHFLNGVFSTTNLDGAVVQSF